MIKRIVIGIMALAIHGQTTGQTTTSNFYVGLDLVKPAMAMVERGYIIEPTLSYKLKDETTIHLMLGKSVVNRDNVFKNIDYQANGYYVKAGGGTRICGFFEPSFNLAYTTYTETGKSTFSGPYYGDWTSVLRQKQKLFFIEAQINFWIKLSDKLYIIPNARIAYMLDRPQGTKFPSYYVPGAGYVLFEEMLDEEDTKIPKSNLLTGGISVRLAYKVF